MLQLNYAKPITMRFLILLLFVSLSFNGFANNGTIDPPNDPPEKEALRIKIPVFGSGGMDTNSGKICPDWCWLCKCATIELDIFRADGSGSDPINIKGQEGTLEYDGKSYNVLILEAEPAQRWTDNDEYDYYLNKENSSGLKVKFQ